MKIGFIGLGIMGEAMSANIAKKHNGEVYTFDVVPEKTVPGTVRLSSALEVAEKSDRFYELEREKNRQNTFTDLT